MGSGLMFGRPQPALDPRADARMRSFQTNHQLLFGPDRANPMIRPKPVPSPHSTLMGPVGERRFNDQAALAAALRNPR